MIFFFFPDAALEVSHLSYHIILGCSVLSLSVMSDSVRPHGLQPARLLRPWDSPVKNTGMGCHAFLQGIFPTRDQTQVSRMTGRFFTIWATSKAQEFWWVTYHFSSGFPGGSDIILYHWLVLVLWRSKISTALFLFRILFFKCLIWKIWIFIQL